MTARPDLADARCEALFASGLQRSDAPSPGLTAQAIKRSVLWFGIRGCVSRMAQEFGNHPDGRVGCTAFDQMAGELEA
jgi:hypothetical protein